MLLACALVVSSLVSDPEPAIVGPSYRFADFDRDGALDVYVVDPLGGDRLFRNTVDGSFIDVTRETGLAGITGSRLAVWQDVDRDGWVDLYVSAANGKSRLLRNMTDGVFADLTRRAGLGGATERELFAEFLDFDGDQYFDLHVVTERGDVLMRNRGGFEFEAVELGNLGVRVESLALPQAPSVGSSTATTPASSATASASAFTPVLAASSSITGRFLCAGSIDDQASGNCLDASSAPQLGMLYPLSSDLNVSSGGDVGIGTTSPSSKLHVVGDVTASGQLRSQATKGTPPLDVVSTAHVEFLNVDLLDGLDASAFSQLGSSIESFEISDGAIVDADVAPAAAIQGSKIVPDFSSQSVSTGPLTANGNVGVGTSSPEARLHVMSASAGSMFANPNSSAVFEGNTASYVSILAPDANESGILFGAPIDAQDAGIIYNHPFTPRGLQLRTGGNATHLVIDSDGKVGIGTFGPTAKLHVATSSLAVLAETNGAGSVGVTGNATATSGASWGVRGSTASATGKGVYGEATNTNGTTAYGVHGVTLSGNLAGGAGVWGQATQGYGVWGTTGSGSGIGVWGENTGTFGASQGVRGTSTSPSGVGVMAVASSTTGGAYGVQAQSASSSGRGVYGWASASSGTTNGVYGQSDSSSGRGVFGTAGFSGTNYGVLGNTNSTSGYGVFSAGAFGGTGAKYFIQPHPTDASKEIRFACLEGNESGTYFRGTAHVHGGRAAIVVPDDFRMVTEAEGLTVQLTASGPTRVWVESKALSGIVVGSDLDLDVDYLVQGVRRGFSKLETIRDNQAFVPEVRGVPYGTQYPIELRRILVENGILNADFTPNEATALRLGWTLRDAVTSSFDELDR
ncbi:MAG: FG-GAP-like repeat-containing protein [Planctomycetes bacterium]|nr:FG-GAP-like repeat-containing protein [Planctomycetota bacterium]